MTLSVWIRRWGKILFFVIAAGLTVSFIVYSYRLTRDLAEQEHQRMELWAAATRELIDGGNEDGLKFPLTVIEENRNIPVVLADEDGNVLLIRNIDSEDEKKLAKETRKLLNGSNRIEIELDNGEKQYIYYQDSDLLRRLSVYPWIELAIIIVFLSLSYLGLIESRKAEQNRLWVGLSKETAHQLGTPISSLMGWVEYLKNNDCLSSEATGEIQRDVERLADVSSRFSKIGSRPEMSVTDLNDVVLRTVDYMKSRVPKTIELTGRVEGEGHDAEISEPLIQWVLENLIKNAVDATEGRGAIDVSLKSVNGRLMIDISDNGKGIPKNRWKRVFAPGYSTKKRGWGVGLTLARRIVEEYHGGKISVVSSSPGKGTTFEIELKQMTK